MRLNMRNIYRSPNKYLGNKISTKCIQKVPNKPSDQFVLAQATYTKAANLLIYNHDVE